MCQHHPAAASCSSYKPRHGLKTVCCAGTRCGHAATQTSSTLLKAGAKGTAAVAVRSTIRLQNQGAKTTTPS